MYKMLTASQHAQSEYSFGARGTMFLLLREVSPCVTGSWIRDERPDSFMSLGMAEDSVWLP